MHIIRGKKKELIILLCLLVIAVLIELFFFQGEIMAMRAAYQGDSIVLDLKGAVADETITVAEDSIYVSDQGGRIVFDHLDIPIRNVSIRMSGSEVRQYGVISIRDESSRYWYVKSNEFSLFMGNDKYVQCCKRVESKGNAVSLMIELEGNGNAVQISSIECNIRPALRLSGGRILLLCLIAVLLWLVWVTKVYQWRYDEKSRKQLVITALACLCCIAMAVFVFYASSTEKTRKLVTYPFEGEINAGSYTAHIQNFDSIYKRISYIDFEPQIEALEGLNNKYDYSERYEFGVAHQFDRSYYNRKYYSYFGITPALTILLPFYAVTGKLPTDFYVNLFSSMITILLLFGITRQFIKLFKLTPNFWMYLLLQVAVVFGSGLFMQQVSANMYSVSLVNAGAISCLYVYLVLRALQAQKLRNRILLLVCSAIACVLGVLARPTTILLWAVITIPLFIAELKNKQWRIKEKLLEVLAFLLPLTAGAAAVMWYNYVRFDNILEFGLTYQLTVRDISYDKVIFAANNLWECIYQYLFKPMSLIEKYPFFVWEKTDIITSGNAMHNDFIFGIFFIPVTWGIFLMKKVFRKAEPVKSAMYILSILCIVAFTYYTYCTSGILSRYSYEPLLIACVFSSLILMELTGREDRGGIISIRKCIAVFCLLSVCIGFFLGLNPCDDVVTENNPKTAYALEHFFSIE